MVDAVSSKSNKRQEKNVAVDAVEPCSTTVTLFGTFIEEEAKWWHDIICFYAWHNALHDTTQQQFYAVTRHPWSVRYTDILLLSIRTQGTSYKNIQWRDNK